MRRHEMGRSQPVHRRKNSQCSRSLVRKPKTGVMSDPAILHARMILHTTYTEDQYLSQVLHTCTYCILHTRRINVSLSQVLHTCTYCILHTRRTNISIRYCMQCSEWIRAQVALLQSNNQPATLVRQLLPLLSSELAAIFAPQPQPECPL
jgi:hypothetical protein